MKKYDEMHPGGFERFEWKNLDTKVTAMTLKHVVQQYCTYDDAALMKDFNKWNCVSYDEQDFTPKVAVPVPEYFRDNAKQPDDFE